jgi:hypothetical protein
MLPSLDAWRISNCGLTYTWMPAQHLMKHPPVISEGLALLLVNC